MSISYPLSLPTTKSPARISISTESVVSISRSPFTFASQVQSFQGQGWKAEITLPPMQRADAEQWICWLLKLNGKTGTFLLGDPAAKLPRGSASGTPQVWGGPQFGNSLLTKGWTPSATGVLLAGDYIQIGYRLYKVLSDVNANSGGTATIDIWPRLRDSPTDNDAIITGSCKGLFRLSENTLPLYDVAGDFNYSVSFSAEESI